jgi:mRNA interferase MazF
MSNAKPKRGDVWRVSLDPVVGSEQSKTRPVAVMSSSNIGRPSVFVCVPVTGFQAAHIDIDWCVGIVPETSNGLTKPSSADVSQIRALDMERFQEKIGKLTRDDVAAIAEAVAFCVGYEPNP